MNSKSEEHSNNDAPITKFGDFYCSLCDIHMNCYQMYETHIKGKRHLKNARRGYSVQKYEYSNEEPAIQKLLDEQTKPIAGLEHIVENVHSDKPPTYHCFLCSANCASSTWLIHHLMGLKHRKAFLKAHNVEQYLLVESSGLTKSFLLSIVEDLISKYEQEHGRGKMSVRKVKEKPGSVLPCLNNENKEGISLDSKFVRCSPKSNSFPTPKRSPPPKITRHSPPPKISRYSPPTKISRYSPPLKISRYSPSPKISRYSPPLKISRYSPSPKISRYSRSRKFSRHSPPPRYFRLSPSPDPFRNSPSSGVSMYSPYRNSPSPGHSRHSPFRNSPSPGPTRHSPSRHSPSPGPSRHSPSRHSPSPGASRHSPSPMSSRCSSPNSFRPSPPPGYSNYFSSPSYSRTKLYPSRSSRYSTNFSRYSPPKSTRIKEQNFKSEWQKISFLEERQRWYYDEEQWKKIEPITFYRQAPTHQRISNSESEQADNYSCSQLFTDEIKNSSDLRTILDQKKSLGVSSRANPQTISDETYPLNNLHKEFGGTFQNNNTTDILSENVQFAHSLDKFIGHYKNRKATQQENLPSHSLSSGQYCDVITSPYNQLNISSYKNTSERTSFKDYETITHENDCLKDVNSHHSVSLQQHNSDTVPPYHQLNSSYKKTSERTFSFKDYEIVTQENDCLKDVNSHHLRLLEQCNDDTMSPYHQLNSSSYKGPSEKTSFNSECSQREKSALPFPCIARDPSVIPGLTLTESSHYSVIPGLTLIEESDSSVIQGQMQTEGSHASNTTVINEYTEKARYVFGNINMPSKSSYDNIG